MKKILAFNGSPNRNGNTFIALNIVTNELNQQGIATEIIQIGGTDIRPCLGCRKCIETKDQSCIIKTDAVNHYIKLMHESDGFIIGSPVYTSNITSETKAFIDRTTFVAKANNMMFQGKIGAPVVVATKSGANFAYAAINFMFGISGMASIGSSYWNSVFGKLPGDILNDEEGVTSLIKLGTNIAHFLNIKTDKGE
ncbi:flavodoxin family protein [Fusibacter bizertensis]